MIEPLIHTLIFATTANVCGLYLLHSLWTRRHVMPTSYMLLAEEPVGYWVFTFTCFGYGATSLIEALTNLR